MKKTLLATALVLAASPAFAAPFNYSYFEGGFGEGRGDGDGLFIGGAMDLQQGFGLIGSYYSLDYEEGRFDGDLDIFTVGVQFHTPLNKQTDFVGSVQLINADWESRDFFGSRYSNDDTGVLLRGGLRFAIQQNLQLEGDVSYISNDFWDDEELGIKAALRFFIDRNVSIAGGVASDQELDGLFVSGRYQF